MKDPADPEQNLLKPRPGSFGNPDPTKIEDKVYRRGHKYTEMREAKRFFAHD